MTVDSVVLLFTLVALLHQMLILSLQRGHTRLALLTVWVKQEWQRTWSHGSLTGSIISVRQMGQVTSARSMLSSAPLTTFLTRLDMVTQTLQSYLKQRA